MSSARRAPRSLAGPIGASLVFHAAVILPFVVFLKGPSAASVPPMYKVELIAAPPGDRAEGVVTEAPAPAVATKAPPKAATKVANSIKVPVKTAKAQKTAVKATPKLEAKQTAPVKDAPKAGGGPDGGKGADVANIKTEGIDFPYKGYLDNIVRQIALNFSPRGNVGALRAEVFFMIHRDGTVTGFKFLSSSGRMSFDLEAQGAVEAAAKRFGVLPAGYADDVLPIVFSFDPNKMK